VNIRDAAARISQQLGCGTEALIVCDPKSLQLSNGFYDKSSVVVVEHSGAIYTDSMKRARDAMKYARTIVLRSSRDLDDFPSASIARCISNGTVVRRGPSFEVLKVTLCRRVAKSRS
jgi:hypothetical protein